MTMDPKISIIILTKNNGKTIGKVLKQITIQQIDGTYEIIIVDSGSGDDTIDQISQFNVRFCSIPSGEFGHGKTRNLASGFARGDFLVFLSADAVPADEHWLKQLVNRLFEEGVAATFGRQIPYEETPPMERFFIMKNYPAQSAGRYAAEDFVLNAFFSNVNSAIKRSVWDKLHFSETLIISEDYYWAKQASEHGYLVEYVPEAAVYHSHNYSLKRVFKRYFDTGASFSQMGQRPGVLRSGLEYFIEEMKYVKQDHAQLIPYAVCYNLAKFLGFYFGKNERCLPVSIKKNLSMHAYYWS